MSDIEKLLQQHSLSKTSIRIKLLEVLIENQCALSEAELNDILGSDFNRSTVYRTLKTLEKAKLLYKLSADDGVVRYFLDSRHRQTEHDHLHFRCVDCNKLVCLDNAPIVPYHLPKGYTVLKNNFVIVGLCAQCEKESDS